MSMVRLNFGQLSPKTALRLSSGLLATVVFSSQKLRLLGCESTRPFANLEVGAIVSDRVVRLLICRATWAYSSK
ncbi:MAG: hypothetical protein ACJATN_001923 [Neolewinella sp.]|jgi:hypothetical protein